MEEVTDKKLIEKIKNKVNNETDISGLQEVTDLDFDSFKKCLLKCVKFSIVFSKFK